MKRQKAINEFSPISSQNTYLENRCTKVEIMKIWIISQFVIDKKIELIQDFEESIKRKQGKIRNILKVGSLLGCCDNKFIFLFHSLHLVDFCDFFFVFFWLWNIQRYWDFSRTMQDCDNIRLYKHQRYHNNNQMGCNPIINTSQPIQIKNSLFHLLHTEQTVQLIKTLQKNRSFLNEPINYRGDYMTHYACSKNNIELIKYLLQARADFRKANCLEVQPLTLLKKQSFELVFGKKGMEIYERVMVCQINLGIQESHSANELDNLIKNRVSIQEFAKSQETVDNSGKIGINFQQ